MKKENGKIILTWEECHWPWNLVFSEKKENKKEEKEKKDNK